MTISEKGLSFLAPLVGGVTVYSSLQAEIPGSDHWQDVWRVGMSIGLGVFVTLVGMIYKGMDARIKDLEKAANDKFVTIREYDLRHTELVKRLDEMVARSSHMEGRLDKTN
jgi:hypothetical protein